MNLKDFRGARVKEPGFDFATMKTGLAYLDNAATSQKPYEVLTSVWNYYASQNANPYRGVYELSEEATRVYEDARTAVSRFIHAENRDEIIFTKSATEAVNMIAGGFAEKMLREDAEVYPIGGIEIACTAAEHHSNFVPWQQLALRTGAKFNVIDCGDDGTVRENDVLRVLTENTRLVAITQVSNVTGAKNDIKKITGICHRHGAIVVLDATQSVPHRLLDVKDTDVDFAVFSGHKMLAPMGIGVLYGKYRYLDRMEPVYFGGEMVDTVRKEWTTFAHLPHRLEAGTVNVGGAVGLRAAIGYYNSIDRDYFEKLEAHLNVYMNDALRSVPGLKIIGPEKAEDHNGIFSFVMDGIHPHDIAAVCAADNVCIRAGNHCAQPLMERLGVNGTARASMMFYNTEREIDALLKALYKAKKEFAV